MGSLAGLRAREVIDLVSSEDEEDRTSRRVRQRVRFDDEAPPSSNPAAQPAPETGPEPAEPAAAQPAAPAKAHEEAETKSCPICFEELEQEGAELARTLPCLHTFCLNCLVEWSNRTRDCALCRRQVEGYIHDIQSDTVYKEVKLAPPPAPPALPQGMLMLPGILMGGDNWAPWAGYRRRARRAVPELGEMADMDRNLRGRYTVRQHVMAARQRRQIVARQIHQRFPVLDGDGSDSDDYDEDNVVGWLQHMRREVVRWRAVLPPLPAPVPAPARSPESQRVRDSLTPEMRGYLEQAEQLNDELRRIQLVLNEDGGAVQERGGVARAVRAAGAMRQGVLAHPAPMPYSEVDDDDRAGRGVGAPDAAAQIRAALALNARGLAQQLHAQREAWRAEAAERMRGQEAAMRAAVLEAGAEARALGLGPRRVHLRYHVNDEEDGSEDDSVHRALRMLHQAGPPELPGRNAQPVPALGHRPRAAQLVAQLQVPAAQQPPVSAPAFQPPPVQAPAVQEPAQQRELFGQRWPLRDLDSRRRVEVAAGAPARNQPQPANDHPQPARDQPQPAGVPPGPRQGVQQLAALRSSLNAFDRRQQEHRPLTWAPARLPGRPAALSDSDGDDDQPQQARLGEDADRAHHLGWMLLATHRGPPRRARSPPSDMAQLLGAGVEDDAVSARRPEPEEGGRFCRRGAQQPAQPQGAAGAGGQVAAAAQPAADAGPSRRSVRFELPGREPRGTTHAWPYREEPPAVAPVTAAAAGASQAAGAAGLPRTVRRSEGMRDDDNVRGRGGPAQGGVREQQRRTSAGGDAPEAAVRVVHSTEGMAAGDREELADDAGTGAGAARGTKRRRGSGSQANGQQGVQAVMQQVQQRVRDAQVQATRLMQEAQVQVLQAQQQVQAVEQQMAHIAARHGRHHPQVYVVDRAGFVQTLPQVRNADVLRFVGRDEMQLQGDAYEEHGSVEVVRRSRDRRALGEEPAGAGAAAGQVAERRHRGEGALEGHGRRQRQRRVSFSDQEPEAIPAAAAEEEAVGADADAGGLAAAGNVQQRLAAAAQTVSMWRGNGADRAAAAGQAESGAEGGNGRRRAVQFAEEAIVLE